MMSCQKVDKAVHKINSMTLSERAMVMKENLILAGEEESREPIFIVKPDAPQWVKRVVVDIHGRYGRNLNRKVFPVLSRGYGDILLVRLIHKYLGIIILASKEYPCDSDITSLDNRIKLLMDFTESEMVRTDSSDAIRWLNDDPARVWYLTRAIESGAKTGHDALDKAYLLWRQSVSQCLIYVLTFPSD